MSYQTIGQDGSYRISIGQAADGTAPTYATAVVVKGFMRSGSTEDKIVTAETSSLGDTRTKKRVKRGEGSVTIDLHIPVGGTVTAQSDRGCYIKAEFKPHSSLAAYEVYEGILVGRKINYNDDPNVETLTIDCDADHA